MKGLIYREFYLSRKPFILMLLVYVLFVGMLSLVFISTYAGNLAGTEGVEEMRSSMFSQMYLYAGLIAIVGTVYGHNDIIEKDYQSHWQLYTYTIPISEKKIAASKFIVRGAFLLLGMVLAFLADIIFSAAAKLPLSTGHFKNILIAGLLYGVVCFLDIPTMLRFRTQAKNAAIGLAIVMPLFAAFTYGAHKVIRFGYAEAKRLYPDLEGDAGMGKVLMPYIVKYRDMAVWIAPIVFVLTVLLMYIWSVKELKRRRY